MLWPAGGAVERAGAAFPATSSHKDACSINMLDVLIKISTDLKYGDKSFPRGTFSFSLKWHQAVLPDQDSNLILEGVSG